MSRTPTTSVGAREIAPPLSLQEVADLFGRTTRTIRNWIKAGLLTPLPIPRGPFFDREQIRALCERSSSLRNP